MRPALPQLVEDIVNQIQRDESAYAGPTTGARRRLLITAASAATNCFVDTLEGKPAAGRRVDDLFRRMGYGEARYGHDLEPMHTALRIATRDSWDRLRNFASEHEISAELLADSADGSGDMLTALADACHDALIKPMPINRAVAGGFTIDDFTIDHQECTATCPAGQTRSTSPKGNVTFGAVCSGCPQRERCTKAKDGRPGQSSLTNRDDPDDDNAHEIAPENRLTSAAA